VTESICVQWRRKVTCGAIRVYNRDGSLAERRIIDKSREIGEPEALLLVEDLRAEVLEGADTNSIRLVVLV
jgi:hypothetical protein